MILYCASRQSVVSLLTIVFYCIIVFIFCFFSKTFPPQKIFEYVLLAILIFLYPHIFPKESIQNPISFRIGGIRLIGKAGQYLPVLQPELGIFIVGNPGCGKTKYVIEPILAKMIQKGYSGILYDYDFSPNIVNGNYSLSHLANYCLNKSRKGNVKFLNINFDDLRVSSRINPIAPNLISERNKLSTLLEIFLANLDPQPNSKDFWAKNTYALLKGIILFLCNYHPNQCTLPHVILLAQEDPTDLIKLLKQDKEASYAASPIFDAYNKAPEQLAGIMGNFKVSLQKLIDPSIFWVLSKNEVNSFVNDPVEPLLICLCNSPTKKELISPILSMIIASLVSDMYAHGRQESFLMIDELPTIFLPNLHEIPATARKYKISTVVASQNIAQLVHHYGKDRSEALKETFANHFVGKSGFELAKEWSNILGKEHQDKISQTTSYNYSSKTTSREEKFKMSIQDIMGLRTGQFVGRVGGNKHSFFNIQLSPINSYVKGLRNCTSLPIVNDNIDIDKNFLKIEEDIKKIISS